MQSWFAIFILLLAMPVAWGCGAKDEGGEKLDLIGPGPLAPPAEPGEGGYISPKPGEGGLHQRAFVVDLIEDLVFRFERDGWDLTTPGADVNVDKLVAGGVDLLFSALPMTAGPAPWVALQKALAVNDRLVETAKGRVQVVSDFKAAKALRARGDIPMMLLLEGADALDGRLDQVPELSRRGLKIIGLVASRGNRFADSAASPRDPGGLTEQGRALLETCRDLGVLVDLTHASETTFWDVLAEQSGVVVVSHTAARALREHPRNLNDLQILALARYGGVFGLVFNPDFLKAGQAENRDATIDDVIAHIMHASTIGAIKAVALGTDYNGVHAPRGLDDVSRLPALTEALRQQGFSDAAIEGVLGGNAARLLEESERAHGSVRFTQSDIMRPLTADCDVVTGEFEGAAKKACNRVLLDEGTRLPPRSKQKFRIMEMTRRPRLLELFGDPGSRWQVEGQNLTGKSIFTRIVQLNAAGNGRLPLPANRNLTRIFCSPTKTAALREAVVWGQ